MFFFQSFNDPEWEKKFTITSLPNYTGKWEVAETEKPQAYPGEKMLFMRTTMSYYGISTKFPTPLELNEQTLVLQYEIRLQEVLECGGAYLKLFSNENFEPTTLSNETRYVIMFGPDKCGGNNKVHFIFRHKNQKTGVIEEKHMTEAPQIKTDSINHLYTLIVRPDNSFEILIDAESVKQGNLLTDFAPSVNPPKEIDDPTDKKPEDWVDNEMYDDPEAKKPEDWDETQPEYIPDPEKLTPPEGWLADEPLSIPDPEAKKPEDWDDDIHGEWEAPTIPNPKCEEGPGCGKYEAPLIKNPLYKGKWTPPQIKNPAYKGQWKPRQIPNPDYTEDLKPYNFAPMLGAGFELWMVNKGIGFDNILISTDEAAVHQWNKVHFTPKHKAQETVQKKEEEKKEKKEAAKDFVESLKDFAFTLRDSWMNLYNENQAVTIAFTALAGLLPIVLILVICCRKPKAVQKKVVVEKKEEVEEKKEEVEEKKEEVEEKKEEEEEKKEEEEEKKEEEEIIIPVKKDDKPKQRKNRKPANF